MAFSDKQPIFILRKETSPEFKFRKTKPELLNWFYHVLAIEFRFEDYRMKRAIPLLSAWDDEEDYDFSALQEIDHYFSDHPLLAMAFNVLVDSKNTFIRLKVPSTSTWFLNNFKDNYNNIWKLDDDALTRLYLTRQVEREAMKESRFQKVLYELLKQEPPADRPIAVGDGSVATYCQKLVTFYGYSKHWEDLMNCMAYYLDQKASEASRDSKAETTTENEPKNKNISNLDDSSDESMGSSGSDSFGSEKPKKVSKTPEQKFIKNMCYMLKMDNKSLLQELKDHVWQINAIANEVLKLASHPRAPLP